jgi:hypothetical protein
MISSTLIAVWIFCPLTFSMMVPVAKQYDQEEDILGLEEQGIKQIKVNG